MIYNEKKLASTRMTDEEYTSDDFFLIIFSLLESKGYTGFLELQAVVDDTETLLKILRLMAGMNIKIPSLSDFSLSLKTCVYIYYSLIRESGSDNTIRNLLNITEEEEKIYAEEFKKWYTYILKQGYDIEDFMKITTKNRKLRVKMRKLKNEFQRNASKRK